MKKTNIEEIADKLRIAWNKATYGNFGQTWENASELAKQGYIAVAKAAVECAGENQYRDLTHEDADKVIKHLSEVREDQAKQIRDLEGKLESQTKAKDSWMKDCTKLIQERAKWEEACRARDGYIGNLHQQLETERNRLAACGVVACADTPESAAEARKMLPEYHSAACGDVERRVDECMELRKKVAELQNTLDIAQRQNRDYFREVEKLRANNAALHEEMRKTQADWEGVYAWIHSNVSGCMGRRCSEVTLELSGINRR